MLWHPSLLSEQNNRWKEYLLNVLFEMFPLKQIVRRRNLCLWVNQSGEADDSNDGCESKDTAMWKWFWIIYCSLQVNLPFVHRLKIFLKQVTLKSHLPSKYRRFLLALSCVLSASKTLEKHKYVRTTALESVTNWFISPTNHRET